jgi:hypothetical protein
MASAMLRDPQSAAMPVHDWTRVESGIFHHFHLEWVAELPRALNRRLRGTDYYALAEQLTGPFGPDVLTLQRPLNGPKPKKSVANRSNGGVALATSPPKMRYRISSPPIWYAKTKKAVVIHHASDHRVVAVLEILSPGNKTSQKMFQDFIFKAREFLRAGVHFALVDLFPPTPRDPEGIHVALWGTIDEDPFHFDPKKPLTCASYQGGMGYEAFVEPFAIGDKLPMLPIFLTLSEYIEVPLETTYQAAFAEVPDVWREVLEARRR